MDIEKLIVSLRSPSWQDLEDPDAPLLEDAAHALSTLQAENERLKNKLSELAHFPFDEPGIGERTRLMAENAELRAELEQVKRERDAVLNAFRGFIQSGHLCEYCAETLKDNPACSACEKWSKFQWRGVGEDT